MGIRDDDLAAHIADYFNGGAATQDREAIMNIHGNEYTLVKDRVIAAHTDSGFSMLSENVIEMRERSFVRILIECKGKQYIGTSEIKWNANPKTPDGMSPYECAQTSALGRALGFAGYGSVESIASADEVVRNEQQQAPETRKLAQVSSTSTSTGKATSRPSQSVVEASGEEVLQMIRTVKSLLAAHYQIPQIDQPAKWQNFKKQVLGLPVEDEGLSLAEVKRLRAVIDKKIEQAKGAA